jgi:hypothetical protein
VTIGGRALNERQTGRASVFAGDVPDELDLACARALGHLKLDLLAGCQALERDSEHEPVVLSFALVFDGNERIGRVDPVEL